MKKKDDVLGGPVVSDEVDLDEAWLPVRERRVRRRVPLHGDDPVDRVLEPDAAVRRPGFELG